MKIVTTAKGNTTHTENDFVVFLFNDDAEINEFITKLAQTEVKTSGMRVLTLVPNGMVLNELQKQLLGVLDEFDGVFGKDHDAIVDNTLSNLKKIRDTF